MDLRRRRLGEKMRELRSAHNLTMEQLCGRTGWSMGRLSRFENGQIRPTADMVMDLLDAMHVAGPEYEELVRQARLSGREGWWKTFDKADRGQRSLAELEGSASAIRVFTHVAVPGLLQTKEYARVRIMSAVVADTLAIDADNTLTVRMRRQRVLGQVDYQAVIDEAALRRTLCPPQVLRDQVDHLLKVTNEPGVQIRILTHERPTDNFVMADNPFMIFEYDGDAPMVVVDQTRDVSLVEQDYGEYYRDLFSRLQDAALTAEESAVFLMSVLESIT